MRVLVTGASGLVGSHLLPRLLEEGHAVVALSRHPSRHRWPAGVEAFAWDAASPLPDVRADAAVNLVGEPVVGKRWTEAQKQRLWGSRVVATRHLVDWLSRQGAGVLVTANASGYYGTHPEGPCTESRQPGEDYLAQLCAAWQKEAQRAPGRVVVFRFGNILSTQGGYLGTLLPFARFGLAGPVAGGRQPMPWVHVDDVVGALVWALGRRDASGAYNLVSPGAAGGNQKGFAKAVGRAIRRPLQVPVPGFGLRLRYGAGVAPVVLGGQDARSDRLREAGYAFQHTDLDRALADLLKRRT